MKVRRIPIGPAIFLMMVALLPLLTIGSVNAETATPPPVETVPAETATSTPTSTPIPITPTATGAVNLDLCEPNDDFSAPCPVMLGQTLYGLALEPVGDQDYFNVYLKAGQLARVSTFPVPGTNTDTRLFVYTSTGALLGENDDRSAVDLGSSVAWAALADGFYTVLVDAAVPFSGQYDLLMALELPTSTPTSTSTSKPGPTSTPEPTFTLAPTATPYTQPDVGEPNFSAGTAFEAVIGTSYPMTLGPRGIDDHDFYRVLVKAGRRYRCAAEKPAGVAPTLRVYSGPVGGGVLIAENDDVSLTDVGSEARFDAPYDGPIFVVVETRAGYGSYTFVCAAVASTPAAGSGLPSGPASTPTLTVTPTATPIHLSVRPLPLVQPTATPAQVTTIRIQVIYDLNANGAADPDEGIANVSVRAVSHNAIVGWSLTDERGLATITILGEVDRVLVPFLSGWNSEVEMGILNETVLSIPAVPLPVVMPVITSGEG